MKEDAQIKSGERWPLAPHRGRLAPQSRPLAGAPCNQCNLEKTKYLWLKKSRNLSEKQDARKEKLLKKHLKTARAYSMRVELQDIYEECGNRSEAEPRLKKLVSWMMHSRLSHMKHFEEMLKTN